MKTVNALTIRNQLGKVLNQLARDGEPILVSKGRKIRAVLITVDDFKIRFLDRQAEEERDRLLERIESLRAGKRDDLTSLDVLREMRGYGQ
ncbi:MAG: type II toxin-antitoxin system Phd/YefM family antitoxin [Deltaproteobacteria bacterium]|nr:type II toxin-antitoxin system Phd/YefM family antitoxin [Deltaproteobacteria bacterium]